MKVLVHLGTSPIVASAAMLYQDWITKLWMQWWNSGSKYLDVSYRLLFTTPDRRQSKMLMLSMYVDKIIRNRVFDCLLSPDFAPCDRLKTLFLPIFDPRSSIVKNVFVCHRSGLCTLLKYICVIFFVVYFSSK